MIPSGEHHDYSWVEWDERGAFLRDLLQAFPQLVVGKYLVNTSFDSGPLPLTESETRSGWTKDNGLTLSPVINSVKLIPFDQYDEWYVFESPQRFSGYEVFVNYGGFSLHHELYADVAVRFWDQLSVIQPETYLSEGDNLICVTRDKILHNQMIAWKTNGNSESKDH